jgi:predicted metal-binding membrane protein
MQPALRSRLVVPRLDAILIWGAITGAWIITVLLVGSGNGSYIVDHDAVLENRQLGWALTLLLFVGAWQLMTAAMMLPSSMPMMAVFLRVSRRHARPLRSFGAFMFGYFAIWTGFAVAALAGDAGVHWLEDRSALLAERPWLIGGSVLVLAGAFQFSSLKERCLDTCRDPLAFFWSHYVAGKRSAWKLGVRHGLFCLGCCWALMLTMFAVGMGSLAWMTALAGVMVIEKTTRYGNRLATPIGIILIVWGASVTLNFAWLPAFARVA